MAASLPAFPIPAVGRLLPWPAALIRQAPLPGRLPLHRVGDAMVMVRLIGPAPVGRDGLLRRVSGDQAFAARADEVLPPGLDQRCPDNKPVFWLEELDQRPLLPPVPKSLGNIDFLLSEGSIPVW
jgi:hypothetical protein